MNNDKKNNVYIRKNTKQQWYVTMACYYVLFQ